MSMPSEANPYHKHLGERDPQEVISQTAGRLSALVQHLGPEGLERSYAPGKWSVRQVLCHLADCEIAFSFRLRQALAAPNHVIQPFDQDLWAKPYRTLDGLAALATFSALRMWNLALLRTLTPEHYATPVSHPERGAMTFATLIETMAGHDLHHLGQLEPLAEYLA
jgi:uncharacterized damage-inducible protein DinB